MQTMAAPTVGAPWAWPGPGTARPPPTRSAACVPAASPGVCSQPPRSGRWTPLYNLPRESMSVPPEGQPRPGLLPGLPPWAPARPLSSTCPAQPRVEPGAGQGGTEARLLPRGRGGGKSTGLAPQGVTGSALRPEPPPSPTWSVAQAVGPAPSLVPPAARTVLTLGRHGEAGPTPRAPRKLPGLSPGER